MERRIVPPVLHHAAAGEKDFAGQLAHLCRDLPLQCPEGGFALCGKNLRNGAAGLFHNALINVNGLPARQRCQGLANCGFAAAGHANEDDVGALPPQQGQDALILAVGNGLFKEVLLCRLGLGHQHG